MISLLHITEFLGWALLLNIAILSLSTLSIMLMKERIISIHSKMFGVNEKAISLAYFNYLSNYKMVTLVFFAAPYISIKMMTL